LRELSRMGFQVKKPSGGCSLWVKLPDNLKVSAMEFCLDFMRDCGVAVTPGEFFEHRESRYFRVALVAGEHQLSSFIEKLRVYSQR
jgi:aspartate/methionine/tyrosine aminotransferase